MCSSLLFLVCWQIADKERSREALSKAKSVLSDSLPVIMRSSGGAIPSAVGAIYLLQPQVPHESWKSLTREQQSVELGYKKISSTEYFNLGMFMKVGLTYIWFILRDWWAQQSPGAAETDNNRG